MIIRDRLSKLFDDNNIKAGIWFFLLNSAFVFLISLKYFVLLFSEAALIHPVYSVFACFCHFTCITLILFWVLFLPAYCLTHKYKVAKYITIVVTTLSLIVLAIDAYVFSLYRFHLNSYVMDQIFGPSAGQVFEFTLGQYIIVISALLLLFTIEFFIFKLAEKISRRISSKVLSLLAIVWFSSFIFVQSFRTVGLMNNDRSIVSIERHFPMVLPIYPTTFFSDDSSSVSMKVTGCQYDYPKNPIKVTSSKKNLLIIAFDSWRYTTMDSLCTPNIYSFSKNAITFHQHYSGSNGTKSGVFSIFYGLSGSYFNDFMDQSIEPVFLQSLKNNNYEIRLFPSASLRNPPLDKCTFLSFADQCDPTQGMNAWQRDVNLSLNFINYLSERDTTKPFMSFLFFDSLHSMIKPDDYKGPFQPSWENAKYELLGKDVDPTEFLNLYKNMVYYLDSLVGNVLNEMQEKGLLENTIVLITGDHAQEFDDNHHAFWGHNGNFSDAQIRVPLIYYYPECQPMHYNHWTAHYDIVPTLMHDMMNVENPITDYSIGKYLQDTTDRTFLMVDSYIGVGMIDSAKNITNIFYDGTYQITDSMINEDFKSEINKNLVSNVRSQQGMFLR